MKRLNLYVPKLEDYWYEEKIESDPQSMSYNAGYDVNYDGYHYDTGCIDFPKSKWQSTFEKRIREKRYFAYIKDEDLNEFVGYVNYQLNKEENKYYCGIVIESKYRGLNYAKQSLNMLLEEAKKNGIKELYDDFEKDRANTLALFKACGFEIFQNKTWKKFNQDVEGVIVKKVL